MGNQDNLEDDSKDSTKTCFTTLFVKLTRAFCRSKHPLTIFLDDMQWADDTSLQLISFLASSVNCCPGCQHLLIHCAYRDAEISDGHPLTSIIENDDIDSVNIQLLPLNIDATNDWLHST